MTKKLYTCFLGFKKQKSISSTKKTPLQYPNLDRFPSLQGHICRPVALCASNGGKLDRQVGLESITTWMEVYDAHSHHKPLSTYRQDCTFTLCSISRARLQHERKMFEQMKRQSIRGFVCNRAGRLQNACRVLLSEAGLSKSALQKQRCCRGRLFSSEYISWPPSRLSSILRTRPRMSLILGSLFCLGRCFRWDLCVKVSRARIGAEKGGPTSFAKGYCQPQSSF